MTFLWREALWLLVIVPALIAAYGVAIRRRKYAVRYASLSLLRDAVVNARRIRPHVPPLLFMLSVIALLVAAARPTAVTTFASEQRTIVLAIDVSQSMSAADIAPSRIDAARAAAKAFIRAQPSDVRVGIVAFSGEADMVQRPTTRRGDLFAAIDALQLNYNTAIGSGILAALLTLFPQTDLGVHYDIFGTGRSPLMPQRLARNQKPSPPKKHTVVAAGSYASAAIVLLTDGRETIGVHHSRAAEMAAERGVRIYTVGFGTDGTSIDVEGEAVDVGFDEQGLKDVAEITHGAYFHASDAKELNDVYRTLSGHIVLERKSRELTELFAALGALLMLSSGALSLAWCGRLV